MTQIPNDIVIGRYGACERQLLLDHLAVLDGRRSMATLQGRFEAGHEALEVLRTELDREHGAPARLTEPAPEKRGILLWCVEKRY